MIGGEDVTARDLPCVADKGVLEQEEGVFEVCSPARIQSGAWDRYCGKGEESDE